MLRRSVVLDLSVAFGERNLTLSQLAPLNLTPPSILEQRIGSITVGGALLIWYWLGLGTTFGYLFWYGTYTAKALLNPSNKADTELLKAVNVQDTTCPLHGGAICSTRSLSGKGRRTRVASETWQCWDRSINCQWTKGLGVQRM